MADVSFNEEPQSQPQNTVSLKRSVFMSLAYATGIPKNDTQAQQVLLVVAGLLVVAAIAYFVISSPKEKLPPPPPPPPATTYESQY